MSFRSSFFGVTGALALVFAGGASAAVFTVGASGTYSSVNAAFAAAIAASGDNEIQILDDNAGAGYTEPRMDLPATPLGNISITAVVPVKITRDSSASPNELFRNLCATTSEYTLTIGGPTSATITLFTDKAAALVSCQDPPPAANNGRIHLENVNLEKSTAAPIGPFLQVDSSATGQQYLKNVNFVGGPATNTAMNLMRAGSYNPLTAQDLHMENVNFQQARGNTATTGMLILHNRVSLEAKSCVFRPAASNNMICVRTFSDPSGFGASGGSTYVFRDCQFQSGTRDAFKLMGLATHTTPNVFKLYRPTFFAVGTNLIDLDDANAECYVLGLLDNDQPAPTKVSLNGTGASNTRLAHLRGNGKVSFQYCSVDASGGTGKRFEDAGTLVGNPRVEVIHCDFARSGSAIFSGGGTSFAPVISIDDSVYIGPFGAFPLTFPALGLVGTRTGTANVVLTQCTFTQSDSAVIAANGGDSISAPGTIFDGTLTATIYAGPLQTASVPALAWNSLGASGFTSVPGDTVIADPKLSATGHLTVNSTAAFGAATGSTSTTDIDNDPRPNPAGTQPDLGADEVSAPVNVASVAVVDGSTVRVTFSAAVTNSAETAANYALSGSGQGTLSATPDSVTAISATEYDLAWSSGEMFNGGDITITTSNIVNPDGFAVGPTLSGMDTGGAIGVAPEVVDISLADASPTNAATVNFTVKFSEPVSGFSLGNGGLTETAGTLNGAFLANLTPVSGDTYTVTVGRGTGDVSFRLDLAPTPAVTDAAGNAMSAAFITGPSYVIEELRFTQDLDPARNVVEHEHVVFTVALAGGVLPRTLTWYYSSAVGGPFDAINDASGTTYEIPSVAMENAGYYYVVAIDANQTVQSATQHLSVEPGIPVMGLAGLALVACAAAATGVRATRRK